MKRLRFLFLLALCFPFLCFSQDDYTEDTVIIRQNNEPVVAPPPPMEELEDVDVGESTVEADVAFNTIGQTPPVEVKKLPPQTVDNLKKDDDYWYADLEPNKPKPKKYKPPPSISTGWLRPLFWVIIIGGLIAGVIWFLANNDVRLFGKPSKKIDTDEESEEELTDDIFAINYEKEIRRAEDAGNYRLAVRLMYLRTLRELSDRSLIDYRYGKTNSDYVSALYGGKHYKPFFSLTRTFDYTWYGQFPLSPENYKQVAADFMAFKNGLGA